MKKLICICLFCIFFNAPLFSQFEKGSFELGGSFGSYYLDSQQKNSFSESNNNSTAFICSLSPAI